MDLCLLYLVVGKMDNVKEKEREENKNEKWKSKIPGRVVWFYAFDWRNMLSNWAKKKERKKELREEKQQQQQLLLFQYQQKHCMNTRKHTRRTQCDTIECTIHCDYIIGIVRMLLLPLLYVLACSSQFSNAISFSTRVNINSENFPLLYLDKYSGK